ncbi:patatin-like phospholipase family protein [Cupriavidus sp. AU9028]|uniref:patatin-like phospholipase family protein n=1 Tax=Cupriavidus sp. AU9028 TaxID=2871157 RepID=UPI00351D0BA9
MRVNLALQGGGAHGAFVWGVLDRLLEEPWLIVDSVCGSSAGAINAVIAASALSNGDKAVARARLAGFWEGLAGMGTVTPFRRGPLDVLLGRWSPDTSPLLAAMDFTARMVTPFDLQGPTFLPFRQLIASSIDFDALATGKVRVFITATHVRTGGQRVFDNGSIHPDALLASACLPTLFKAVQIDGEPYWDGGYHGNPNLAPLIRGSTALDTILVQINPVSRADAPLVGRDVASRINEIAFNAALFKELRMAAMLREASPAPDTEAGRWAAMRFHRIASESTPLLGYASKYNAEWAFFQTLRDEGRQAAQDFLDERGDALGQRSSIQPEDVLPAAYGG